jgi:hypothetical protein
MPRPTQGSNPNAVLADSEDLDEWHYQNEVPIAAIPWLAAAHRRTQAGLGSYAGMGTRGARQWWRTPSGTLTDSLSRLQFKPLARGAVETTEISYQASGGTSLLMRLDDGDEMQVEIHLESYAVLWSSQLSASAAFRNLAPLMPGMPREAIAVRANGTVADDVASVLDLIAGNDPNDQIDITFFRLRYEDRIVSWEECRVNSPDTGLWVEVAQLGFLADRFDEGYLVELIRNTAPRLGVSAPTLGQRAAEVVADAGRFPAAQLGAVAGADAGDATASD